MNEFCSNFMFWQDVISVLLGQDRFYDKDHIPKLSLLSITNVYSKKKPRSNQFVCK